MRREALFINKYQYYLPVSMYFKLVNLTALFALQVIEDILATYPKDPYQIAFSIPYLQQQLIVYVLNRFPNRYTVVETKHDISKFSNLLQFPVEECLAIENLLSIAIINLLQDYPNWQDYQYSVQDMPIDTFSLDFKTDSQLLSGNYNNRNFF